MKLYLRRTNLNTKREEEEEEEEEKKKKTLYELYINMYMYKTKFCTTQVQRMRLT